MLCSILKKIVQQYPDSRPVYICVRKHASLIKLKVRASKFSIVALSLP
jgi:hypothetical protein